tara:strand:- start:88 stop:240 length:153 start_codon:yes stop_codon:yes gene_type:complete
VRYGSNSLDFAKGNNTIKQANEIDVADVLTKTNLIVLINYKLVPHSKISH